MPRGNAARVVLISATESASNESESDAPVSEDRSFRQRRPGLKAALAGCGLIALFAGAAAFAASSSSDLYFRTSGQNIWGTGAANPLAIDHCLCTEWGDPYPDDYYKYWDLKLAGDVWGATSGRVGLDFKLSASPGSMALSYPMQVTLTYPDPGSLISGSTFAIGSQFNVMPAGFALGGGLSAGSPTLQTVGPGIAASLDAVARIKAVASGNLFGVSLPIIGPDIDTSYRFFGVDPSGGIRFNEIGGILSGHAQSPDLNTRSNGVSGNDLQSSMRGNLGGVSLNLANLAMMLVGGPPLSGSIGPLDYNLVKVGLGLNLDLEQSFTFAPRPEIHLDFTSPVDRYLGNGNWSKNLASIDFPAGDTVYLRAPLAEDIGIVPRVRLNNETTNITDAIPVGQLDLSALALGVPLLDWSIPPLIAPDPLRFDVDRIRFYDNTFNLDTGPAVAANPLNLHFRGRISVQGGASTGMCALAPDLPQCETVSETVRDFVIADCTLNPQLPQCQGVDWSTQHIDPCALDPMFGCSSFNVRLQMPQDCFGDPMCELDHFLFPQLVKVNGDCTENDALDCLFAEVMGKTPGTWNDTKSTWVFANDGFADLDGISLAVPETDASAWQRFAALGYNPDDYRIRPFDYSAPEPATALLILCGLLGMARRSAVSQRG